MKKRFLTIINLLMLLFIGNLLGGTTGKIAGTVVQSSDGTPLMGANVMIVSTTLGAATDTEGYFTIINIPPGKYQVKISMMGYKTIIMNNIIVTSDHTTRINPKMEVASIQGQEVVVVASKPLVQADLTSSKKTVSSEEIENLPAENPKDILSTQAGVTTGADGALHVRGGRSTEVTYMMDGIPVSDDIGLSLSNDVISELTLISGTFNAEYGKAMSGVVSIATKEGSKNFEGKISTQFGDMFSANTDIFDKVDEFSPFTFERYDLNLSGPIALLPGGSFFVTGTMSNSDGWLYGKREHSTYDTYNFIGDDWQIDMNGDGKEVAMNTNDHQKVLANMSFKPLDNTKFRYQFLLNNAEWSNYDHVWKYNPDGTYTNESLDYMHAVHLTQTLSNKAFFTVKGSYKKHYAETYVHKIDMPYKWNEDINGNGVIDTLGFGGFNEDLNGNGELDNLSIDWDFIKKYGAFIPNGDEDNPLYVTNQGRADVPAYHFVYGGQKSGYYVSDYDTWTAKFDFTSQITKIHLIKTGLEFNAYKRRSINAAIEMSDRTMWQPYIQSDQTAGYDDYTKEPFDFSAYFQDKIEIEDIIIQAGLRYDFFDANDYDFTDDINPAGSDTMKVDPKSQVSPRLGVSFPITDQGFIHFSYGHFFQMPSFTHLYRNPSLKKGSGLTRFGNPDLDAQKTVMYELGLQQQLSPINSIDVTIFYRDIINWLSSEYNFIDQWFRYTRYTTRDYGNIRGITFSYTQRSGRAFTMNLDYTYQIAEGNSSSPDAQYYDNQSIPPVESEKYVIPLDWDIRHSINAKISLTPNKSMGVSLINSFETGRPYTPSVQGQRNAKENSGRKPFHFTTDLNMYKYFKIGGSNLKFVLKVYNLFDRKNENYVHDDTGRANSSLVPTYAGQSVREHQDHPAVHSLDEYLYRPTYYSNPRQILLGISYNFSF